MFGISKSEIIRAYGYGLPMEAARRMIEVCRGRLMNDIAIHNRRVLTDYVKGFINRVEAINSLRDH